MRVFRGINARGNHLVLLEQAGEVRAFFEYGSLATVDSVIDRVRADIERHGPGVVGFPYLPQAVNRVGTDIYDVEA